MAPFINSETDSDTKSIPDLVGAAPLAAADFPSPSETHEQQGQPEKLTNEPIAIVGIGCRLPGDVKSPSGLWDLLMKKESGYSEVPADRWNIDAFYHPNGAEKIGCMSMRGGYYIHENLREFENSFFGINNVEATFMDPQQRKLLEVVYECLESAGVTLEQINGANIGTFCGSFTMDYWMMQTREPDNLGRYHATGMGTTILSNRISHVFNLRGPSFTLDTGCSSSLYSLHQACSAIDAGECDAAIVAASNLIQSPEQQLGTMKAGVLSPTGICHTFDESADGYGRADGVGAIYLKKLSQAIADGDPIRSVIRGTAVNSNGKTPGISLPSADGQEAVMRKAYAKAGLTSFSETAYVECHGTGTPVGDPIEVEAVSRVFGARQDPLLIGSVKTNLGHSEATSGLSSIIKATLALEKGCIPATIGVQTINPKIKVDEWNVKIVTDVTPWPAQTNEYGSVRRIGINSFGYGGANSHAIIESAASHLRPKGEDSSLELSNARLNFLVPFSASNQTALEAGVSRLANSDLRDVNVVDLAYTLGTRRSNLAAKGYALVGQKQMKDDLQLDNLRTIGQGNYSTLPIAFVFTGQGAQWPQMGKELIEEFPTFRQTIQDLDAVLKTLPEAPSWTIDAALLEPKETSQINHASQSQPLCTAVQVALVDLLAEWGIKPYAAIGHSSGEICAAYASGRLTAAQAIIVAYYRGYAVTQTEPPVPGAMMAVGVDRAVAEAEIQALGISDVVKVACVNSPQSVTISGNEDGIDSLKSHLDSQGMFARKLNTNGRAYHSHHMLPIGKHYQELLEKSFGAPSLPAGLTGTSWYSSVYAEPISAKIMPSYWRQNLESPVLFSDALAKLMKGHKYHLIEIGPHSALEMPIKQTCKKLKISDANVHYSTALSRGKNAVHCMLELMGNLYLHGQNIAFDKVNYVESSTASGKQGKVLTDLPTYPWTYDEVLFNESRSSQELRNRKYGHHDLLGLEMNGGNRLSRTWRNTIKVKDVPWIGSHKLGQDVVFPAAGYVAMAIEAQSQISGVAHSEKPTFALRHLNILKALQLSADENSPGTEVFTSFNPTKLSGTTTSGKWSDFEITSFENGTTSTHATGMICLESHSPQPSLPGFVAETKFQEVATRNWYDKFAQVGLNFGPSFQSMDGLETDQKRERMCARSTIKYLSGGGSGATTQSNYVIHPVTIDAMLQTALVASSAGVVSQLQCMVPTSIKHARFRAPDASLQGATYQVDAISKPVGPGSINVEAELHNHLGEVFAQVEDVSAVAYDGAAEQDSSVDERDPMMRSIWKPDIEKITRDNTHNLEKYFASAISPAKSSLDSSVMKLAAVADIVAHKNPKASILELGYPAAAFTKYLFGELLRGDTGFKRCSSYTRGYLNPSEGVFTESVQSAESVQDGHDKTQASQGQKYTMLLFPTLLVDEEYTAERLELVKSILSPGGYVLALLPSRIESRAIADSAGLDTVEIPVGDSSQRIVLGKLGGDHSTPSPSQHHLLVVEREAGPEQCFSQTLSEGLSKHFAQQVPRIPLNKVTVGDIKPATTVISTIELGSPILKDLSVSEMSAVKLITDNAANILWITGGGQIDAVRPDFAMASGFARSLILEQPSLKFYNFDVEDPSVDAALSMESIVATIKNLHVDEAQDLETVQKDGLAYTSRFVPEEGLNEIFRQRLGDTAMPKPLEQVKPTRLTIQKLGQFDTLAFKQDGSAGAPLSADYVEVDVKSIGLNAKDVYVYSGKVDTPEATSSLECAGLVTRVGSNVRDLAPGDRVVVMAPGHFATLESFPWWACEKLEEKEDFHTMSTMPLTFATALYGLCERARLQKDETVLIHSGAGGVGIAAIQVAQFQGAEIFTTVSTEEKTQFLIDNFGIKRENIFNSRDSSFLSDILSATGGKGVDVVLNSLTGDLLHDSWRACARFGRFVEIGKRDLTDAGKLDMQIFRRNVSFTAFDVSELCDPSNSALNTVWARLLKDVMRLYRGGKIRPYNPLKIFDCSEISQAFRHFSSKNRMGKIAVSFEDGTSLVRALPLKFDMEFYPEKSYILSGCLGGIGRSISKWMLKQGARNFVFIGRSGLKKEPARRLVQDLEDAGASVHVVTGDIGVYEDAKKCADAVDGSVGGVIQAAMGLDEAIFTSMTNESWHTSVRPKVQGTWNLHNVIQGKDQELDFFLMTSSVAGSVGTATETNYTAANAFLDNFAKYRRRQGKPATSIGLGMISEVGYLHENPEIEAILLRKGIQPIKEEELLSIIDIALARPDRLAPEEAHVLTGLETQGLKKLRRQGFEGTIPTLNDPRAAILASSVDGESDVHSRKAESGLPPALSEALEAGADAEGVLDAIVGIIIARLANLILVRADKIAPDALLAGWGMDSMLASEFRTWFFMAFTVDIPFLFIMGPTASPKTLGEMVMADMLTAKRFEISG